jgi:AcrR family transcriptional regulator
MTAANPLSGDDKRTRLLDTAGEVFAESGYQAATVREICTRAGVNLALVNYYFGDKLELYTEVLRRSLVAGNSSLLDRTRDESAPPEEALRGLIGAMVGRICGMSRKTPHVRLMVQELAQPTPAMPKVIDEAMRPVYDRFRQLIGAILNLPVDGDTVRLCTSSIIGQIVHYAHARHVISRLWPELEMTPERIAQIAAHIADFSLAGIGQYATVENTAAPTRSPAARRRTMK